MSQTQTQKSTPETPGLAHRPVTHAVCYAGGCVRDPPRGDAARCSPRHRLRNLSSPSRQHVPARGEDARCRPGTAVLYHSRCLLNQRRILRCPLLPSPRHGICQNLLWSLNKSAKQRPWLLTARAVGPGRASGNGCLPGAPRPAKRCRKPRVLSPKHQAQPTHHEP